MPINYRPATFSAPSGGGDFGRGSGSTELSHAGLSTAVESQVAPADIHSAHTFFRPPVEHAVAGLPAIMPGAESAALAAVPPGGEPISPIIQMIMKMPGHLGIMSSFFEWLGHMFLPAGDILGNLDLSALGLHAQEAMASLASGAADHLPINPSLLPQDAPILQQLGHADLSKSLSLSEHTSGNPLNVSGQLDVHKPQFETGSSLTKGTGGRSELLSGPSMSDTATTDHLAGSQRLFSDKLSSSPINPLGPSATLAQNLPASATTVPSSVNVAGSPFGAELGHTPPAASLEPKLGPSGAVGDKLGGQQLLSSSDVQSYRPTLGGDHSISGNSTASAPELKAKELSLNGLKAAKPGLSHVNSVADHIAHQTKGGSHAISSTHDVIAKAGHPQSQLAKPHFSKNLVDHKVTHVAAKHAPHVAAKSAPHVEAKTTESTAVTQTTNVADTNVPAGSDATAGSTSYTVHAGDNLWDIAKSHLGSGFKWQEVYNLNKDILGANPDMIQAGTTIQLPGTDIASSATAEAGKYIVQPGDNLWNIAKDHLGGGDKWGEIFKSNSQIIGSNPGLIQPGQELTLGGAASSQVASSAPSAMTSAMPSAMPSTPPATADISSATTAPATTNLSQGALSDGFPMAAQPVLPASGLDASLPAAGAASAAPMTQVQTAVPGHSVVSPSLRPDLSFLSKKPFGK